MDRTRADFDILFLADFRPGDTGTEAAQRLLKTLGAAGYAIGVVSVWGSADALPAAPLPDFSAMGPRVRPVAQYARASARLILATDLRLFSNRASATFPRASEVRLVLCPRRAASTPQALRAGIGHAEECLGGTVTLAPAAPTIRADLWALAPEAMLTTEDWPPILGDPVKPPANLPQRTAAAALGFFTLNRARPWPADTNLDAVLPRHPLVSLDLCDPPEDVLHHLRTGSHSVHCRVPEDLTEILFGVDALTTYAKAADDPWPEEVLIGLRHGVIPLLPPEFRPMFGAAALYAQPARIAETVIDLFAEPEFQEDLRKAGKEFRETVLSGTEALARVEALIGPPEPTAPVASPSLRPRGRILSLSTNGVGMGHLSRQMAIARRQRPGVETVFLSFSQSVHVVRRFGWIGEYLPYHVDIDLNRTHWNAWLLTALEGAMSFYDARALVLDANVPFRALEALRERHPGFPMIWVRRAMWGEGRDLIGLDRASLFDAVIEPGEIAGIYDTGPTTTRQDTARCVDPIMFLDEADLLSRADAAAELGLDPDRPAALLLPGGLNNHAAQGFWAEVSRILARDPSLQVVAGEWAISKSSVDWAPGTHRRQGFPYARWFRAFDFAVSAAGYNSFSELTRFGLPVLWVPNENPLMDRQDLRARYAARNGFGDVTRVVEQTRLKDALGRLCSSEEREMMRVRLGACEIRNGAQDAANIIGDLCDAILAHRGDAWL